MEPSPENKVNKADGADAANCCSTASDLEKISQQVKQRVFGQDEHVDKILRFINVALTRNSLIQEGADTDSLPQISSMLLVAPTASGKTHTIKMITKTLGMPLHTIDASMLTGEGWRGNNISSEWLAISNLQKNNPNNNILVFIDEIDKLTLDDGGYQGFSPKFELLKPLEGGTITGEGSRERAAFEMDCDRCIFIFSGAFSGIEETIAKRLNGLDSDVSVLDPTAKKVDYQAFSEAELRNKICADDIESWGFPRELVGRFSFIDYMAALSKESLHHVLFNDLLPRYSNMMLGGSISIDEKAATIMLRKALSENYGARSLNQQLSKLFFRECWKKVDASEFALNMQIVASEDNELECLATPADSLKHENFPFRNASIHSEAIKQATMLLESQAAELEKAERGKTTHVLKPFRHINRNINLYEAALCKETKNRAGSYTPAEVLLLHSLLHLASDWLPEDERTPSTIRKLLTMTNSAETGNEDFQSVLDNIFNQIETGYTDVALDNNTVVKGPSSMKRHTPCDRDGGVFACEVNGFGPDEDEALGSYTHFKTFSPEEQTRAILLLSYRFIKVESEEVVGDE